MKRLRIILSLAIMLLGSSTVSAADEASQQVDRNFLGLTAEQRVEDYEYLWQNLRESYPFFGVVERQGIDTEAIYEEYKQYMENCEDDVAYFSYLYSPIWRLQQCGHITMFEPEEYFSIKDLYNNDPSRKVWADALNNPLTQKNYEKLAEVYHQLGYDASEDTTGQENSAMSTPNIMTYKLIEDQTAYVKIQSFDGGTIEQDQKKLLSFYKEIADYDNLIIDLTENSGGSDYYWSNLIVAPNIKESVTTSNYALMKSSENNRPYLENAYAKEDLKAISSLPAQSSLNPKDLAEMTHYVENQITINPIGDGKLFKGKIWVLVSGRVYSSSESFCMFCKDTGFATLVGTQTGGDGGGIDPVYIVLPNSGFVVRYSMLYTLNTDGGNSEECGTTPDIVSKPNENPLVTCLEAIKEEHK